MQKSINRVRRGDSKMSDENLEMVEDQFEEGMESEDEEQLDEFKASMGDPSEVPEPVDKSAAKLPGSKEAGEKTPVVTPGSKPPKTKVAAINAMMTHMSGMKKGDLIAMHTQMMGQKQNTFKEDYEDEDLVPVKQAPHITRDDIDLSDDIEAMFGDEDLSEDFKEKATIVFEAAVVAKINDQLDKLSVEADAEIEVESAKIEAELTEKLDSYMDYVVEEWTKENEIAIERGLKAEITEDFLQGLQQLFAEHYIDIPEEKVDVAEELASKVGELEDELNKEIEKNVELSSIINEATKYQVVHSVGDGLSDNEKEKLAQLADGIEFSSEEEFADKLTVVKEQYFSSDSDAVDSMIEDDSETVELDDTDDETQLTGPMAAYSKAISRTVNK